MSTEIITSRDWADRNNWNLTEEEIADFGARSDRLKARIKAACAGGRRYTIEGSKDTGALDEIGYRERPSDPVDVAQLVEIGECQIVAFEAAS